MIISLPNLNPPLDRFHRLLRILPLVGPGIFCVGYTSGTGAVTKLTAASQMAQVFVFPLVVGSTFMLLNREELMGAHKAGFWLNAGLIAAFGFSLILSWSGLTALGRKFA